MSCSDVIKKKEREREKKRKKKQKRRKEKIERKKGAEVRKREVRIVTGHPVLFIFYLDSTWSRHGPLRLL